MLEPKTSVHKTSVHRIEIINGTNRHRRSRLAAGLVQQFTTPTSVVDANLPISHIDNGDAINAPPQKPMMKASRDDIKSHRDVLDQFPDHFISPITL